MAGGPSEAELEATGLTLADLEEVIEVWPEHQAALDLFSAMLTQWRVGMGGATGLDYAALPVVMGLLDVPAEVRRERFGEIRLMERAALDAMRDR